MEKCRPQLIYALRHIFQVGHQRGYGVLMEELSHLVQDNTKHIQKMSYLNLPQMLQPMPAGQTQVMQGSLQVN